MKTTMLDVFLAYISIRVLLTFIVVKHNLNLFSKKNKVNVKF
jgi:hypothetical protein